MITIVNMPVEAISEQCLTCPELDIDIFTNEKYDLVIPEEGKTAVKTVSYENRLRCKHCDRCQVIFDHANGVKEGKPKTTKKTTTKKTVAKK